MTLAHGEEVLVWMGIEIIVLIGFILFILLTKQKVKHKLILTLVYILSELGIIWFTKEIPYLNNNVSINLISFVVPIVLVLGTFFILKITKQ